MRWYSRSWCPQNTGGPRKGLGVTVHSWGCGWTSAGAAHSRPDWVVPAARDRSARAHDRRRPTPSMTSETSRKTRRAGADPRLGLDGYFHTSRPARGTAARDSHSSLCSRHSGTSGRLAPGVACSHHPAARSGSWRMCHPLRRQSDSGARCRSGSGSLRSMDDPQYSGRARLRPRLPWPAKPRGPIHRAATKPGAVTAWWHGTSPCRVRSTGSRRETAPKLRDSTGRRRTAGLANRESTSGHALRKNASKKAVAPPGNGSAPVLPKKAGICASRIATMKGGGPTKNEKRQKSRASDGRKSMEGCDTYNEIHVHPILSSSSVSWNGQSIIARHAFMEHNAGRAGNATGTINCPPMEPDPQKTFRTRCTFRVRVSKVKWDEKNTRAFSTGREEESDATNLFVWYVSFPVDDTEPRRRKMDVLDPESRPGWTGEDWLSFIFYFLFFWGNIPFSFFLLFVWSFGSVVAKMPRLSGGFAGSSVLKRSLTVN